MQKRGPNNSDILQNWVPLEIRSPFFNLQKFQGFEKSIPGSWRNDCNLMNDEKFESIELLTLNMPIPDKVKKLC